MKLTNLKAEKTAGYLWRVWSWGQQSGHAWVTGWNVINGDTGEIVAGGFAKGHNTSSGYPHIARKREAVAFIAGFHSFERGEYTREGAKRYAQSFPKLGPIEQGDIRGFYIAGAEAAKRRK